MFSENLLNNAYNFESNYKYVETFRIENKKILIGLCIALPLTLIGLYHAHKYTVEHKIYLILIAMFCIYIASKQIKNLFSYKLVVDMNKKTVKYDKLVVDFDSVVSTTLQEMKLGNKIVLVLDNITVDRKQIIIPMYMQNKEKLIAMIRDMQKEKFHVKK